MVFIRSIVRTQCGNFLVFEILDFLRLEYIFTKWDLDTLNLECIIGLLYNYKIYKVKLLNNIYIDKMNTKLPIDLKISHNC